MQSLRTEWAAPDLSQGCRGWSWQRRVLAFDLASGVASAEAQPNPRKSFRIYSSERILERTTEDMPERMSLREICQKVQSERMSDRMSEDVSGDMSERLSEDMSEGMSVC